MLLEPVKGIEVGDVEVVLLAVGHAPDTLIALDDAYLGMPLGLPRNGKCRLNRPVNKPVCRSLEQVDRAGDLARHVAQCIGAALLENVHLVFSAEQANHVVLEWLGA